MSLLHANIDIFLETTEKLHTDMRSSVKHPHLEGSTMIQLKSNKINLLCSTMQQHPVTHWRMGILLGSNLAWGWGASTFYILLADHSRSNDIPKFQIAQLFIIVGLLGFMGRLLSVIFCKYTELVTTDYLGNIL